MRVMVLVKATKDSEAGVLPDKQTRLGVFWFLPRMGERRFWVTSQARGCPTPNVVPTGG
jgi:hypothetical protein